MYTMQPMHPRPGRQPRPPSYPPPRHLLPTKEAKEEAERTAREEREKAEPAATEAEPAATVAEPAAKAFSKAYIAKATAAKERAEREAQEEAERRRDGSSTQILFARRFSGLEPAAKALEHILKAMRRLTASMCREGGERAAGEKGVAGHFMKAIADQPIAAKEDFVKAIAAKQGAVTTNLCSRHGQKGHSRGHSRGQTRGHSQGHSRGHCIQFFAH